MIDLEFYKNFYSDLTHMSDKELIAHWNTVGRQEGRLANPFSALEATLDDPGLPEYFDIAAYLYFNNDVAKSIRWDVQAIGHYIEYGAKESRRYSFSYPDMKPPKPNNIISSSAGIIARNGNMSSYKSIINGAGKNILKKYIDLGNAVPDDYNLSTYLTRYRDVRNSISNPSDGLKHYIRHGQKEGRTGTPKRLDRQFISDFYGVLLPNDLRAGQAPAFLRNMFGCSFDVPIYLTERELLAAYKIDSACFRVHFDHLHYAGLAFPGAESAKTRTECLRHFCEIGQYEAIDISENWRFDETFYFKEYILGKKEYIGCTDLYSRQRLFLHWIQRSSGEFHWPNLNVLALATFQIKVPVSIEKQLDAVRLLSPDMENATPSQLISCLLEGDTTGIDIIDYPAAEFCVTVADRHSVAEDLSKSDRIYARVLEAIPAHGRALRHRADQVQRQGMVGLAVALRKQILDSGLANKWTYRLLAEGLAQLGRLNDAAAVLWRGSKTYPGDIEFRSRAIAASNAALDETLSRSTPLALSKGIAVAQAQIAFNLDLATPALGSVAYGHPIRRIAIYGNYDLPQCRFYRIDNKIEHLKAAGYDVLAFQYNTQTDEYISALPNIDLTIVYRLPAFPVVIDAITKTIDYGIPTVYDIDDLIFEAEHYPPTLESYAGQIDAKTHAGLACGAPMFAHAMSLCDYGIASTPALKPYMEARVRSGEAFVARNALSSTHMPFARAPEILRDKSCVTIFYGSGTKAHKQDFYDLLQPALLHICQKYGAKVRVVIFGYVEISEPMTALAGQIRILEPISNIEDYWEYLEISDINLSVLSRTTFNDCKSEIKWLEAAMVGIPSVLSRSTTFEEVVIEGETGFLCDTAADFTKALDLLVGDSALREKIGKTAQRVALEEYSIQKQAENYKGIISRIERAKPGPMKRLLIVNVFYPPQAIGGATRVTHGNVSDLKTIMGAEWSIDVVCTLEGGTTPYEISRYVEDGIRVFAITAADRPDIDQCSNDRSMGQAFERCLNVIQPDLIHFHCIQRLTISVVDVARWRDIPYVITMHDGWWISPNQFIVGPDDKEELYVLNKAGSLLDGALRDRERRLWRALASANRIATVSEPFAALCRRAGVSNLVVTENGVSDLKVVAHTRAEQQIRLGHIGGASRHKGLHLVRHALMASKFKNLKLILVDHALDREARVSEVWGETQVEIRGKTPQSEVGEIYAAIDVLLAPSIWPESYGLVTREAAAAGCWIIASDRGAIGECVSPGKNGFIVDVSSPYALMQALAAIDADPEKYRNPPSYTPALRGAREQAEQLSRLYQEILAERA